VTISNFATGCPHLPGVPSHTLFNCLISLQKLKSIALLELISLLDGLKCELILHGGLCVDIQFVRMKNGMTLGETRVLCYVGWCSGLYNFITRYSEYPPSTIAYNGIIMEHDSRLTLVYICNHLQCMLLTYAHKHHCNYPNNVSG